VSTNADDEFTACAKTPSPPPPTTTEWQCRIVSPLHHTIAFIIGFPSSVGTVVRPHYLSTNCRKEKTESERAAAATTKT